MTLAEQPTPAGECGYMFYTADGWHRCTLHTGHRGPHDDPDAIEWGYP